MTCILPRPSPQVLFDTYKNMFSATVLGGGEIIPESNEWYVTSLNYAIAESFYAIAEQQWKERDPRYACCDNLINLAALDGVYPRAASFAEGYGKVTGTAGSALIPDMQIAFNEQTYKSVGAVPKVLPASGEVTLRFRALQPGAIGNRIATGAQTAVLTTPLTGANSEVSVYSGKFCGGSEAEECEAFRTRYLARRRYAPRATAAWIKEKLLEWPCATRVCERSGSCCTPTDCNDCPNPVSEFNYYVMFDDTFECGLPPQCVADEITTWMFGERQGYGEGQAEIGICGKIYTALPVATTVAIAGGLCFSPSQRNETIDIVTDLFKTFCPSQTVTAKQVELAIAQVVGYIPDLEVQLSTTSTHATVTPCGDIDPDCDYMVCLAGINFPDVNETTGCL